MKARVPTTALLSIAAGFAGGAVSEWLFSPQRVHAQAIIPGPTRPQRRSAATEVDAQRFVLVDSSGTVEGEFRMNGDKPEIVLYDKEGRIGWRAAPNRGLQPLEAAN